MGLVTVRNLVLNRHLVMALHGSIISIARGRSVQSGQRWKPKPGAKSGDCGKPPMPSHLGNIDVQRERNRRVNRQELCLDQVVIALEIVTTALISRLRCRPRSVMIIAGR